MSIELEGVLRLLLAIVLGGIIGYQRERSGKEAGLRTHVLICAGAALFTLTSVYGFGGSDRIAAGIVTGIGFIGAGVILHRTGGSVVGLTTAATIWTAAAIGVAVGSGLYIIAVVATFLILGVLLIRRRWI
jgi:putative Mg2+ transporter-C (MgtC) family protein